MAEFPFSKEELNDIRERANQAATDADDASLRTALQVLGEAAANLAVKLPGADTPDPFEDSASA
ncbi:MAG: hypothetical protein KY396_02360 [Actinobacteria bacterium]|nr:hypothetical protein [Actinomycetota bacterium]